jgi:hypothetical protein
MSERINRDLARMHRQLLHEIREIEDRIVEWRARADALRQTLKGIEQALGINEDRPKGAEAVARVVYEKGEPMTVADIVAELRNRGWMPDSDRPEGAVRSAIRRLRDSDSRWIFYQGQVFFNPTDEDEEYEPDEEDMNRMRAEAEGEEVQEPYLEP